MLDLVSLLGWLVVLYMVYTVVFYLVQGLRVLANYFWPTNFVTKYGEWAVVTGCTRGIGLAYSRELAQRGMNLVLIGCPRDDLEEVSQQLKNDFKVQTKIIVADFSRQDIYPSIASELKGIDIGILVNNVGVLTPYPMYFEEISERQLWEHILINTGAVTLMTSLILPDMKAKRRGAIVNIASVLGIAPSPFHSVYAASKAYVYQLTKALRFESRGSGVTIQTVCPGYVNTKMINYCESFQTKSAFLSPPAEKYAKHAILTLGAANFTAGYYVHEFKAWIAMMVPDRVWLGAAYSLYLDVRQQYFKEQERLKTD